MTKKYWIIIVSTLAHRPTTKLNPVQDQSIMNLIDIFSSMEGMEDGKKRQGVMDAASAVRTIDK
jgi:hypothetical protein